MVDGGLPEEYKEFGIPVAADQYATYCVMQERERCARIAENYKYKGWNDDDAAGDIAVAIRKGE